MVEFDLDYSIYEDCIQEILITVDLKQVRNTYSLLFDLVDKCKENKIPKHLIFFFQSKYNEMNITNVNAFNSLLNDSQRIEITLNKNLYKDVESDESIIKILERLTEYFILIMKTLYYWDDKVNFRNKNNLSEAINQLCYSFNFLNTYLNDEKVIFLRNEYVFTNNIFSIMDNLLKVLENRINVLMKNIKKFKGIDEEINKLSLIINTKKDCNIYAKELGFNDFMYKLVNTIDLYDNL